LKDKEFIAASRFTIADIHALVATDVGLRSGTNLDSVLKEVTRPARRDLVRPKCNYSVLVAVLKQSLAVQ